MITIAKEYNFTDTYGIEKLGKPEGILFFDIETTGLSAKKDMVYLIGCVYFRDGSWHMEQWFADSVEAEKEILLRFFQFSSNFSLLVHFNGTTFDIPFLKERASRFHTPISRWTVESLDIYKRIRPYKKQLGLTDCKQKTLEAFLGIKREDPYNGGQLIAFYWEYLKTGDEALYKFLLLHNEEDIEGLPALLPLLSYRDFFQGAFYVKSEQLHTYQTLDGKEEKELFVTCINETVSLPAPCGFTSGSCTFFCRENTLIFRLPLLEDTLKYFFKNYADYYFLPEEDRAIHKSVAAFVDKAHRIKATAKTCYQKRDSIFLPFPENISDELPLFYTEYKKQPSYIEYHEKMWKQPEFLQKFLLALLPN